MSDRFYRGSDPHPQDWFHGVDISSWQDGSIDWDKFKASGLVNYVFARASVGTDLKDAWFSKFSDECVKREIPFGAYHFFQHWQDPIKQAELFLQQVESVESCSIPHVIDIEKSYFDGDHVMPMGEVQCRAKRFMDIVEDRLSCKMVVYCGAQYWQKKAHLLADRDWWVSSYTWKKINNVMHSNYDHNDRPLISNTWNTWNLWQYEGNLGMVEGCTVPCDRNWFQGSQEQFNQFCEKNLCYTKEIQPEHLTSKNLYITSTEDLDDP